MENVITYEQPLNELIRACLRLEQLFHQIDHHKNDDSVAATRNILLFIIQVLQLLDRPDLKAKLAKELSHQMTLLMRLENTPEIDQEKLRKLLRQLNELIRCFIDSNGKIGQNLREFELLSNLRLHLANPGGGCSFDIPVYHYWLNQTFQQRQEMIKNWLEEFSNIRLAITLILQLVREGTKVHSKSADQGFYQELLDPQLNLRLIRVAIADNMPTYPEISASRHCLSIRFFSPNIHARPVQYSRDVPFLLSFCTS